MISRIAFAVVWLACCNLSAAPPVQDQVNWPEFLARQDPIWEETPKQWNEGAFIGNGELGIMMHADLPQNRFIYHLGRRDVHEHAVGVGGQRMDIGRMALKPAGKILSVTMRKDLWNAEVRGTIKTDLGEIRFRALTVRDFMVHVIDIDSTEKKDGQIVKPAWEFLPGNPVAPRVQVIASERKNYKPNPKPESSVVDGVALCVQKMRAGGDYATTWLEKPLSPGKSTVFITTANRMPKVGLSGPEAVKTVREAAAMPADQLLAPHRDWWHAFYRKSFVSIPDARLQSFYWIQLYKIGSATRAGGRALGNSGPWFRLNQWPQIWWNLNVQITYWMFDPSNHTDLGRTLVDEIDRNFDHLFSIYGGKKEMGDFIWVLHNYWLHYRYLGDWDTLRAKWLPKAERSLASFQANFVKETADGNLELAPMGSPEFLHGNYFKEVKDTNYNLALIRWLLGTMIDVSTKTGGSPQVQDWQKLLGRLPAAPVDAHGLMIGRGQSFDRSHRHFSHIIGFYPLFVLNPDDPADRALVDKSLRHFLDIKNKDGTQDRCGYTLTCAASQVAMMGRGDEALQYLNDFLDNKILEMATIFASRVLPNTMYVETRGRNPTIESPLGAANATLEMLLQSWGGKVRIFPAMPTAWKDAVFHQLRAQGAFLVSAERKNGKTEWVAVESLAGEPLVLKVTDWSGPLVVSSVQDLKVTETAPGEYEVDLKKGGSAVFSQQPLEGKPGVKPLPDSSGGKVFYGLRKGENLKENQTWPEYHPK